MINRNIGGTSTTTSTTTTTRSIGATGGDSAPNKFVRNIGGDKKEEPPKRTIGGKTDGWTTVKK